MWNSKSTQASLIALSLIDMVNFVNAFLRHYQHNLHKQVWTAGAPACRKDSFSFAQNEPHIAPRTFDTVLRFEIDNLSGTALCRWFLSTLQHDTPSTDGSWCGVPRVSDFLSCRKSRTVAHIQLQVSEGVRHLKQSCWTKSRRNMLTFLMCEKIRWQVYVCASLVVSTRWGFPMNRPRPRTKNRDISLKIPWPYYACTCMHVGPQRPADFLLLSFIRRTFISKMWPIFDYFLVLLVTLYRQRSLTIPCGREASTPGIGNFHFVAPTVVASVVAIICKKRLPFDILLAQRTQYTLHLSRVDIALIHTYCFQVA